MLLVSFFDVDVVDGSVALILHNSVACGNSEESLALLVLERLHLLGLDGELGEGLLLVLLVGKLVEDFALLNFSVVEEEVKS